MPKPLYIAITIRTDLDTLWRHTQSPELQRLSTVEYLPRPDPALLPPKREERRE